MSNLPDLLRKAMGVRGPLNPFGLGDREFSETIGLLLNPPLSEKLCPFHAPDAERPAYAIQGMNVCSYHAIKLI